MPSCIKGKRFDRPIKSTKSQNERLCIPLEVQIKKQEIQVLYKEPWEVSGLIWEQEARDQGQEAEAKGGEALVTGVVTSQRCSSAGAWDSRGGGRGH